MLNKMNELEIRLFSKLHHEGVLQRLIKAMLGIEVVGVTVLEEERMRSEEQLEEGSKQVKFHFERLKLLAVLPDQNKIRIEFVLRNQPFLIEDVLGEALNTLCEQDASFVESILPIMFGELSPVYVVNLLNFVQLDDQFEVVSDFVFFEKDLKQRLTDEHGNDVFRLMFIELEKFDTEDELVNQLLRDWRASFDQEEETAVK